MEKFAKLLDPNPRAMKRFVNIYSSELSVQTLREELPEADTLALWVILKTRWPALADYLQATPTALEYVGDSKILPKDIPEELGDLFRTNDVERLVQFAEGGPLTPDLIRACAGPPSKALWNMGHPV